VLVTHHVEEITDVFTHALLLRRGRVTTAGPLRSALTSATISRAFGGKTKLRRVRGRYTLEISGKSGVVI
jgi:iron complex transport system ATP-binding protein